MTDPRPTVLILDDSPEDTQAFQRALREDFQVLTAATGTQGRALIAAQPPDCLLLDDVLPDLTGLEFLTERDPGQVDAYAVIVLTGHADIALAVECMKYGAHDFLTKGRFGGDELRRAVTHGIEKVALRRQVAAQQQALERAVASLQASQARLRLLIDHAPAALAMFDREMRYLAASRRWCADYGLDAGTLVGRSHYEVFPALSEHLKVVHQRALAGETLRATEDRFERQDGSVQWLQWELCPWYEAAGLVGGIAIFSEDITERKQAETTLQQREVWLRLALDAASMVAWEYDPATLQVTLTENAEQVLHLPHKLETSEQGYALIHPDDREHHRAVVAQAMATGGRYVNVYRYADQDPVIWIEEHGQAIVDATGQTRRLVGVVQNITARIAAEQKLERTLYSLAEAQRIAHLGSFEYDARTRQTQWSEEEYRIYGLDPAEPSPAYERMLERCYHPDDAVLLHQTFSAALEGRSIYELEHRIRRPDGSVRWVYDLAYPYCDEHGQILRYIGTTLDITDRKEAELQLRRYRQIVEISSEKLLFIDRDLRYQAVNPAYAEMFGSTPEALQGRALAEVLSPALWAQVRPHLEDVLTAGGSGRFEIEAAYPDGHTRSIEAERQPFWEDGRVQGIVVSLHDLTDLRAAQLALEAERASLEVRVAERTAALQASETKLRTIYDLVPIGISITDPKGRIIDCNRTAEVLLGVSRDEHLRRTYDGPEWALLRPDGTPMPPVEYPSVRALRENRLVGEVEMGVERAAGVTWLSVSAMPALHPDFGVVIAFVDITARKAAEQTIRRYEQIVRSSVDAIYSETLEGRVTSWNPAAETIYGYRAEEVLGQPLTRLLLADTPDEEAQIIRRVAQGETLDAFEVQRRGKDGRVIELSLTVSPIRDATGRILGLSKVARDIGERKAAEVQLRQITERLQLATAAAGIGIWALDLASGEIVGDERGSEIYGHPGQPAPSFERWIEWVEPEDRRRIEAIYERFTRGEESPQFQDVYRVHCPDGVRRFIACHGRCVRDRHGAPRSVFGVVWDVTAEHEAALALAASEARARAVIETSPVPLAIADETGAVRYLNAAFVQTFGYTLDDIPTMSEWRRLAFPDPDERERIVRLRRERLAQVGREGESSEPMEIEVRCKDGAVRTVMARATPLQGGELLNTLYDITELQEARDAAEQAARAKSAFLAHMSHEIRTPMNGILGLAESMLHQRLSPEVRADLLQIHQSATALLGILDDVLDQSKLEAGRLILERGLFDLEPLLATLRSMFERIATAKGLDFRIEAAPTVPRSLLGDPLRLQQVLSNLIGNALKFTDRGEVLVRVCCEEPVGSWANLTWTVADTGIGMDAATLDRLFEPYVQGDDSIARRFGGTGLGLSISQHLVALMGGTLTVASTPGLGTTFTLRLRLGVGATPAAVAASTPGVVPEVSGARILVAEDQPLNQRVIGDLLRLLGAQVTLAGHGGEALDCLAEGTFDAVLMDIQMPVMDGLTATRRLRDNPAWAKLPVIALTAGVTEAERARIVAAGLDDLLPKPVTLDALRAMLGRWVPPAGSVAGTPRVPQAPGEPASAGALADFDLSRLRPIAASDEALYDLLRQFADSIRGDADAIQRPWRPPIRPPPGGSPMASRG